MPATPLSYVHRDHKMCTTSKSTNLLDARVLGSRRRSLLRLLERRQSRGLVDQVLSRLLLLLLLLRRRRLDRRCRHRRHQHRSGRRRGSDLRRSRGRRRRRGRRGRHGERLGHGRGSEARVDRRQELGRRQEGLLLSRREAVGLRRSRLGCLGLRHLRRGVVVRRRHGHCRVVVVKRRRLLLVLGGRDPAKLGLVVGQEAPGRRSRGRRRGTRLLLLLGVWRRLARCRVDILG